MAPGAGEEEVTSITIVRLGQGDWERHRVIRLEALGTAPEMYSTRYEDMVGQPESFWRDIMATNRYFYARLGEEIVGMAGLATPTGGSGKSADKGAAYTEALPVGAGMLISVFISEKARGRGVGQLISEAVIAQAGAEGLTELVLDVAGHNAAAQKIYLRLGFDFTGNRRSTGKKELEMRLEL